MTYHVDIPESIANSISLPAPEIERRLRTELAVALYAQGILSAGGRQVIYSVTGGRDASLDLITSYQHRFSVTGLNTQGLDATMCTAILPELSPPSESSVVKPLAAGGRYVEN